MLAHTGGSLAETECDASLHIKGEERNQTLSLTYSTSAKHNIDNGCTTPTSKPLSLLFHTCEQKLFTCTMQYCKHFETGLVSYLSTSQSCHWRHTQRLTPRLYLYHSCCCKSAPEQGVKASLICG